MRLIENAFGGVVIVPRGLELSISGPPLRVEQAKLVLENIASLGPGLSSHDVYYAIRLSENGDYTLLRELSSGTVVVTHRGGKQIRPKTAGQRKYVQSITENDIVFGIGPPAGTGKTFLAMAVAVAALRKRMWTGLF